MLCTLSVMCLLVRRWGRLWSSLKLETDRISRRKHTLRLSGKRPVKMKCPRQVSEPIPDKTGFSQPIKICFLGPIIFPWATSLSFQR